MNELNSPETAQAIKFRIWSYSSLFDCFFIDFMIYFVYWNDDYFKYLFVLFALFGFYLFMLNKHHFSFVYIYCIILFMCIHIYAYIYIYIYIHIYQSVTMDAEVETLRNRLSTIKIVMVLAVPVWHFRNSVWSKTAIFPEMREGNVPVSSSMNLHGVDRSARPTSRWAPKAHNMMGKTQQRHCERSFGTNVLVLGKQRDNLLSPSQPLNRMSTIFFIIEQVPNSKTLF